jgi:hypothetical protein
MEALAKLMDSLPELVRDTRRFLLGTYRRHKYRLVKRESGGVDVYREGATSRKAQLVRDNPGPRAVLHAVERLAVNAASERDHVREDIAVAEGQLRDHEGRIGSEFTHSGYMSELADLRGKLKLGLLDKPPEGGMPVGELAERIKALRAENAVEAAPERTGTRKRVAAEQPVTARIRARRAEPVGVPEPEPFTSSRSRR